MFNFEGYSNFPFPAAILESDIGARDYFYSLDDEKQLEILNQCQSYEQFVDIVRQEMECE